MLRTHRVQQLLHKLQAEGVYEDSDLVFADSLGAPLNPMAITRVSQGLAKRVGMGHIRVYGLRHFHASVMFKNGQSPALVSKRLGHASVCTTMDISTHNLPGWQREAANACAKAMEQG